MGLDHALGKGKTEPESVSGRTADLSDGLKGALQVLGVKPLAALANLDRQLVGRGVLGLDSNPSRRGRLLQYTLEEMGERPTQSGAIGLESIVVRFQGQADPGHGATDALGHLTGNIRQQIVSGEGLQHELKLAADGLRHLQELVDPMNLVLQIPIHHLE